MTAILVLLAFGLFAKHRHDCAARRNAMLESVAGFHGVRLLRCRHAPSLEEGLRMSATELCIALDKIEEKHKAKSIGSLEAIKLSEQVLSTHCMSVDLIKREEALRALVQDLFTREEPEQAR